MDELTHGDNCEYLHQVVLHYVPDYPALVEIAASPLGSKILLEADCHRGHVMPTPRGRNEFVAEPEQQR